MRAQPGPAHQHNPHYHPLPPPQVGGSDVLVLPMTYIFNEEPVRWRNLLKELGMEGKDV